MPRTVVFVRTEWELSTLLIPIFGVNKEKTVVYLFGQVFQCIPSPWKEVKPMPPKPDPNMDPAQRFYNLLSGWLIGTIELSKKELSERLRNIFSNSPDITGPARISQALRQGGLLPEGFSLRYKSTSIGAELNEESLDKLIRRLLEQTQGHKRGHKRQKPGSHHRTEETRCEIVETTWPTHKPEPIHLS